MMRKIVAATVSVALCILPVTPALAQDYRFAGFDSPRGATATANFKMPFGGERTRRMPSYGVTFGLGQTMGSEALGGRTTSRSITLADLRFTDSGLQKAEVASFNLASLDQDRRLNMMGEGNDTLFIVVGLVAAGVAICLLADCFEGDDDSDSSSS